MHNVRTILAALLLALAPAQAVAQTTPNLRTGQVPTAAQWNNYFAAKQDLIQCVGPVLSNGGAGIQCGTLPNDSIKFPWLIIAGKTIQLGESATLACSDLTGAAASCSTNALDASNINAGTLSGARLPAPTATMLGGIKSASAPANQFQIGVSTAGLPIFAQPTVDDILGLPAALTASAWRLPLSAISASGVALAGDTAYSAWPAVERLPSGRLIALYGRRNYHTTPAPGAVPSGVIMMRTSDDGGATWSAPSLLKSASGYDYRMGALGVTASGRVVFVFNRYTEVVNPGADPTLTWIGPRAITSDDEGATWSAEATVSDAAFVHGRIIEAGDGNLIVGSYSAPDPAKGQAVWGNRSSDGGATWQARTAIIPQDIDPSVDYAEAGMVYAGSGRVIALVRQNNGSLFYQTASADNGVTWTFQGAESFDGFSGAPQGPAHLTTFVNSVGRVVVRATYQDRSELTIRAIDALASDLMAGPSAWMSATRVDLGTFTTNLGGYPTFVHACPTCNYGSGLYYDEATDTSASLRAFVSPIVTQQMPIASAAVGAGVPAPDGSTLTLAGGGSHRIGLYSSYAEMKFGIATGGVAAAQCWTSNTAAARACALNPFGGNVGIGHLAPTQPLDVSRSSGAALPAISGTSSTAIQRLRQGSDAIVLDSGAGPASTWQQSTSAADLSLTRPHFINPNGGNVGIGKTTASYPLDVGGAINADAFRISGVLGLSATKTIRDAAGTGTCTLIFTSGLLTGGTC